VRVFFGEVIFWVLMARNRRLKIKPEAATYHCVSRTINGEKIFGDTQKEVMRKQLRCVADFCGVTVVTFVLMSNHFHILVRVPEQGGEVADTELMRRLKALTPSPTLAQATKIMVAGATLKSGGPDALALRKQLLARMGDVSAFMKEFKQRVAMWYNKSHKRFGPLWSDRFSSTIIEGGRHFAFESVAAYIDLNPVRAGIVEDPKDYRFCGYAEAVATGGEIVKGLRLAVRCDNCSDEEMLATYRVVLFGKGSLAKRCDPKAARISVAAQRQVAQSGGRLTRSERFRSRVGWFSRSIALGSATFVSVLSKQYGKCNGLKRRLTPASVAQVDTSADWPDDFCAVRKVR
jgi:REP element-mobilizing transposase RayT